MARMLVRVAGVLAIGVVASACSSIPDWVDPTSWLSSKAPASEGNTPELADIPGKPPTTTPDDQKQVADSLAADRAQAGYSAEQLRAGAEQSSSAPPPPAAPPQSAETTNADSPKAAEVDDTPPEPEKKGNATFEAAQGHTDTPAASSSTPSEASKPATSQQVASAAPPTASSQPDSSLGFQASTAPAPDASVGQFLSPSLLNQYQKSASLNASPASTEASTGAQTGPAPVAVVDFPGSGTKLTAAALDKVRQVAQSFQSNGASGFVRVVGHATIRSAKLSVEKQQRLTFQRSQDRANAVARELIKDGVPAAKVLVETAGEGQSPEASSAGAEIFLQS